MQNHKITHEIIFDEQGMKIVKNIYDNKYITYMGINLNENAVNKYIQSPSFQDVREYLGC